MTNIIWNETWVKCFEPMVTEPSTTKFLQAKTSRNAAQKNIFFWDKDDVMIVNFLPQITVVNFRLLHGDIKKIENFAN